MDETLTQMVSIIAGNLAVMLTFFGFMISMNNGIRSDIQLIQQEMKDFYRRLSDIEKRLG